MELEIVGGLSDVMGLALFALGLQLAEQKSRERSSSMRAAWISGSPIATQSPATPSLNPFQHTNIGGLEPAVFKFAPDGKQLLYYSVLGSNGWDEALGVKAPLWTTFMTKLTPDGKSLVYSTFLGGANFDIASGLALGFAGNAYVDGVTGSVEFPVRNSFQPAYGGGTDGFLAEISDNTPIRGSHSSSLFAWRVFSVILLS